MVWFEHHDLASLRSFLQAPEPVGGIEAKRGAEGLTYVSRPPLMLRSLLRGCGGYVVGGIDAQRGADGLV